MDKMVGYLTPQLKRTYDGAVRTLMPWRMIDALETLQEVDTRAGDGVSARGLRERRNGGEGGVFGV